jgi:hypothetical protein
MYGIHHKLKRRVNNRTRLFRIEVFDEVHRIFDISEQGCDSFPFAFLGPARFHRGLLGKNALREVSWSIANWRLGIKD